MTPLPYLSVSNAGQCCLLEANINSHVHVAAVKAVMEVHVAGDWIGHKESC